VGRLALSELFFTTFLHFQRAVITERVCMCVCVCVCVCARAIKLQMSSELG